MFVVSLQLMILEQSLTVNFSSLAVSVHSVKIKSDSKFLLTRLVILNASYVHTQFEIQGKLFL